MRKCLRGANLFINVPRCGRDIGKIQNTVRPKFFLWIISATCPIKYSVQCPPFACTVFYRWSTVTWKSGQTLRTGHFWSSLKLAHHFYINKYIMAKSKHIYTLGTAIISIFTRYNQNKEIYIPILKRLWDCNMCNFERN